MSIIDRAIGVFLLFFCLLLNGIDTNSRQITYIYLDVRDLGIHPLDTVAGRRPVKRLPGLDCITTPNVPDCWASQALISPNVRTSGCLTCILMETMCLV